MLLELVSKYDKIVPISIISEQQNQTKPTTIIIPKLW